MTLCVQQIEKSKTLGSKSNHGSIMRIDYKRPLETNSDYFLIPKENYIRHSLTV